MATAFVVVSTLGLAGCSGGSASTTALDEASCDALLSEDAIPAAAAASATGSVAQPAADKTAVSAERASTVSAAAVADDEKKSITFVGGAYTSTTEDYWKDLAARFADANPGYTVDVQIIDWNNIDQRVATMIQTQQYPDILNQNKYSGWASNGLLQDASELLSEEVNDDFIPAFKDAGVYEGTQYGIPFITSTRALFYNKTAFAEAGIDGPPETWRELVDDAKKLEEAGYTGYGLPLGAEESQAEWSIWMWGNGGDWQSAPGEFTVNSEKNVETLTVLNCLTNVYEITQPNPGQTNRTDGVFRPFADGTVGMMAGASFAPSLFEGWDSSVDYGVAPLPVNGDIEPITLGVQDYLMSFENPGNKTAVSKFLDFFYQEENYVEFLTSQGFLPATQSASDALESDPAFGPFLDLLPTARFYPSTDPTFPAVQGAVQNQIGTGVTEGADIQGILDAINAAADQ
ncbi:extracellular solute-binding protein [Microbacterium sp. 18062]|uniref:extracellular solute-binding protein n=1 Tax=Microbacterium sp. 18062 TaxID=2681410 RepID=UPI0013594D28|nr:extracellular solute-binding protein [Microbacterium sp. 18062]